MLLDEALPKPRWRETHRIAADGPARDLLRGFDELTWAEVPVFRALMGVRGLIRARQRGDARVYDWFVSSGFVELARADGEILIVSVQPAVPRRAVPPPPRTIDEFRDFAEPGCIKIAFNFSAAGGQLSTATRVEATDVRARRIFAAYWLVIRPWSGLIRGVWLRAIRARAGNSATVEPPVGG